jgi:hypothetical protein
VTVPARLCPVKGLDLALLVAAEHQRVLGRVQVQAHHVQQLVFEARISRDLEGTAQVGLQAVATPGRAHRCGTDPQVFGQRARTPVRGVGRLLVQRGLNDARLHLRHHAGRPTRPRRVLAQRVDTTFEEAGPPERDLPAVEAHLCSDLLVLPSLGRQQHDARTLLKTHLDALALRQHPQFPVRLRIQLDRLGNPHRPPPGRFGVCRGN